MSICLLLGVGVVPLVWYHSNFSGLNGKGEGGPGMLFSIMHDSYETLKGYRSDEVWLIIL